MISPKSLMTRKQPMSCIASPFKSSRPMKTISNLKSVLMMALTMTKIVIINLIRTSWWPITNLQTHKFTFRFAPCHQTAAFPNARFTIQICFLQHLQLATLFKDQLKYVMLSSKAQTLGNLAKLHRARIQLCRVQHFGQRLQKHKES